MRNYKIRDKYSHRQTAVKLLKDIEKMYSIALHLLDSDQLWASLSDDSGGKSQLPRGPRMSQAGIKILRGQLKSILEFQKFKFGQLE